MSRRAPSSTPSDAPPPYEDESLPPRHFSAQPEQRDSKIPLDPTRHDSTASTSFGPSSEPAPHGVLAKLKEKKDALKQNLDEGIVRGKSDEGVRLANRWNSQHLYASFGVPIASLEKWQEHEDKKQAKKEFERISKEVDWKEAGSGNRNSRGSS